MKKRLLSILTTAALLLTLLLPTAASAAAVDSVTGDADGNGTLTIRYATAIQRHLAGLDTLSEENLRRSMVTGGAELTILDATAIQRRLAQIIDRFPVEIVPEPTSPQATENPDAINAYEQHVISLINDIRRENNLTELTADPTLCRIARIKAQDMHDGGYFDHTSPTYGTPFEMMLAYGIRYQTAAENIAYGYKTPQAVVDGWMNSSGHRENILNPTFTKIGVGYVSDGNYWTQLFTN